VSPLPINHPLLQLLRRVSDVVRVDDTLGSDGGYITSALLDD